MTLLSELTTLHLGGPARDSVEAHDEDSLVAAVRCLDRAREPLLLLAGGSNLVIADEGFPGTVVRVLTSGIEQWEEGSRVYVRVQAGEPWDRLVTRCVEQGLAGIECLSGIPGSVGATPMQNVGAYGQEVSETVVQVRVYDRVSDATVELTREECGFEYRSSVFKRAPDRWVMLAVTYALQHQRQSKPIRYAELARALKIEIGETAPLPEVRAAVLRLRRAKGMVLDPGDPDTVSAGSFFLNPVLDEEAFERMAQRVRARLGTAVHPPAFPQPDGRVKTSAAWLIERVGYHRGYGDPEGIAISSKHTLALTNRGSGTTAELLALAREIADGVRDQSGVPLTPEPVLVGHSWASPGTMVKYDDFQTA